MTLVREGHVEVAGHRTYYRVVGAQDSGPALLTVHGGPAIPHDYLEPLERLAAAGRTVVLYDQLGCGRSDRPEDRSLYTLGTFVDEIDAVRGELGLDDVHLFAHSMGGSIALEYALRRPPGLLSLVLASCMPSVEGFLDEQLRLLEHDQGREARRLAERHTARGSVQDPEFRAIVDAFLGRHMTHGGPWPACVDRAFDGMGGEAYAAMWGSGGQFDVTGGLAGWDVSERLGEIEVPTLVTHGRHDYVTVALGKRLASGIRDARLVVFEDSGHLAFAEETERYLEVLEGFLRQAEQRSTGG